VEAQQSIRFHTFRKAAVNVASQQERDTFLAGWRAAMEEVLAVLETEAREWADEEAEASNSGSYKLPGSFALEEVRGSFKGRRDLLTWIRQSGPAAARANDPSLLPALDALVENRATDQERALLGLAPLGNAAVAADAPPAPPADAPAPPEGQ
jgi:hypothetical protein